MTDANRCAWTRPHWTRAVAPLLLTLVVAAVLLGCSGPDPTTQIVVVTATFTPEPVIVVVTATFTPLPEVVPSDTPPPTEILPQATATPIATETPPEATVTPTEAAAAPTVLQPTDTPAAEATSSGKKTKKTPSVEVTATELATTQPVEPSATSVAPEPKQTDNPPENTPTAEPVSEPTSFRSYYVVYTAFKGPDLQDYSLWGMNGDGSDIVKVEGAGRASEPAISPDGVKLAFYHWTDGLHIWDSDKETLTRIVDNSESSFPTWSPNGKQLAYTDLYGQPQVYLVNQDGSDNHPLTPGLRPNWSLKGGFIAYDSCENNRCGIFRINPDGGGKRQLTEDGGGGAAVSPDGTRIAYWSKGDGDFEVYTIHANGSGKRQLTKNQGNDALPAWSPDGKIIYYLSDQNGTSWAVMAMNADGSNQRKIVGTSAGNDPVRGWQYQRIAVTWNE